MEKDALERLLKSEYGGLLSLLRRKVQDPQLAADLLNDAMLTALTHLQEGRVAEPAAFAGYVFQVAINLHRNHRRKHSERVEKRAGIGALDEVVAAEASPPSDLDDAALAQRVRMLMLEIPAERDRVLLTRFYLEEDEKDAICRDLGLSPLHFDKVIFRARKRLKALFESSGLKRGDFLSLAVLALA